MAFKHLGIFSLNFMQNIFTFTTFYEKIFTNNFKENFLVECKILFGEVKSKNFLSGGDIFFS